MEKIESLDHLLAYLLQHLLNTQTKMLEALSLIREKAKHHSVRNAFNHYIKISEEHLEHLKKIEESFTGEISFSEIKAAGILGIIEEIQNVLKIKIEEKLIDGIIIHCTQNMQQYKITCCTLLITYAKCSQQENIKGYLRKMLSEEKNEAILFDQLSEVLLKEKKSEPAEEFSHINREKENNKPGREKYTEEITYRSSSSTHDIQYPGGRAGVSHRTYPDGESRGH